MSGSVFYDAPKLDQIAINLFYGWGYNFYRLENQLRADDLLIREKAGFLLGQSRAMLEAEQSAYRRTHLPPPSRAHPLPPPEAVEAARALEDLSTAVGTLEGTIRSLPVPETDRMTQRYRQEAETLATLAVADRRLIGLAGALLETLEGRDYAWILPNHPTIMDALALLQLQVRERQALLK
jgi:hypothetical protein